MKTGLITKIIKFLLVVIIPLTAGTLWGIAAYGDYENIFFDDYYMVKASDEDSEDRLVSYLKFLSEKIEYNQTENGYEFYHTEKYSNEYGDLFTFSIIRTYSVENKEYTNKNGTVIGKRDTYSLKYYFAVYDINYATLVETLDPSGDHKLLFSELPQISFKISNKDENVEGELEFNSTTTSNQQDESLLTYIYDYGYSPEVDSDFEALNGENPTHVRFYALSGENFKYTNEDGEKVKVGPEVKIEVIAKSNYQGEDVDQETKTVATVEKTDFYDNDTITTNKEIQKEFKKLENMKDGYNRDVYAAGYAKYSIGHHVWWQVLLTILIVEVICGSFVLVWGSEVEKMKKEQKQKK